MNKKTPTIDMSPQISRLLFEQISKPKNYTFIKVNNVYDNRFRVNLYCETEEENLIKRRICASYFCSFINNQLNIISAN
jgi:hypothetical protein